MGRLCVFGATGNVGSCVADTLIELKAAGSLPEGTYVRLVTRSPDALRAKLGHAASAVGVEVVHGDVSDPAASLEGVSRAFLSLPQCFSSDQMDAASQSFTDAAVAAGVGLIVRLSSLGIDGATISGPSQGRLGASHARGEAYARERGITLTSIRPTSFTSNFLKYDLDSVRSRRYFSSPLGFEAAVNWITCRDIGAVAAHALADPSLDGRVLDVTGPTESTLTAPAMAKLLSADGSEVRYEEVPVPPVPDLQDLWTFLRAGGFNCHTSTVEDVTGQKPTSFSAFLSTISLT